MRMAKLTDYALLLLFSLARSADESSKNARGLALAVDLPFPTVSKLLKSLLQSGILESRRGAKGGYALARVPEAISLADVIRAVEGPLGLTECSIHPDGGCQRMAGCPVGSRMRRVSSSMRYAFEKLTLAKLLQPLREGSLDDGDALLGFIDRRTT